MNRSNHISTVYRQTGGVFIILLMITAVLFLGNWVSYADDSIDHSSNGNQKSEKNPYVITADTLIVDGNDNSAEFNGNVKITQGNLVITARQIRLLFREDPIKENTLKADEASIKEIIASDTVTIKLDNKIALTNHAVYNTQERVLVLSGENSQIIMDENTITGNQITFYRTDGRIAVEGGQDQRVKAIFYNGEKEMK